MLQAVQTKQGGKSIEMKPQTAKIIQLARYFSSAAAAIAVFVVGYQLLNNNNNTTQTNEQIAEARIIPMEEIMATLNDLSANDVKMYVNANSDEFDELLDDSAILNKLDVKNLKVQDFTQDISTDDIKAFVNSNMDEFDEILDEQISDINFDNIDLKNIDLKDIK